MLIFSSLDDILEHAAGDRHRRTDSGEALQKLMEAMLGELAGIEAAVASPTQGNELMALPSITSRRGQSGTVELIREWMVPKDGSGEAFETHKLGQVMQIHGSPLGFGHDLAFTFTATTAEVDSETGKPDFIKRIDVSDSGFSTGNGTRFVVQTRPDGSKSIVLVTSSLIDATGRLVHGGE